MSFFKSDYAQVADYLKQLTNEQFAEFVEKIDQVTLHRDPDGSYVEDWRGEGNRGLPAHEGRHWREDRTQEYLNYRATDSTQWLKVCYHSNIVDDETYKNRITNTVTTISALIAAFASFITFVVTLFF